MPADTGAPHYLQYPIEADALGNIDEIIEQLALGVEARLPYATSVPISVTASDTGTAAVVFPTSFFATVPRVVVSTNVDSWFASIANLTAAGCDVNIRRPAGASTATVTVHVIAVKTT